MIRALIVDDEGPARDRLRRLLSRQADVEIVGEAGDGDQALQAISRLRPDLVFLDIQMPGRSGLEVAAALHPPRPSIVFCTAFDQHAVSAFELHALDYLLKPVNSSRLKQALDRIRQTSRRSSIETEIEIAGRVQEHLFPKSLPQLASLDYTGLCRAAGQVGGDYYDFLSIHPGRLGIALGDVSGKGLYAGLLMAGMQGQLQTDAPVKGDQVAALVSEINRRMCANSEDNRFATLFYGIYEDAGRTLTYTNAGHPPALILSPGPQTNRLDCGGAVVGLLPEARYEQTSVQLQPGSTLIVYSDGVTEAAGASGEEFGEERLAKLVRRYSDRPASELCRLVLDRIAEFSSNGRQRDDMTLIVAHVR